MEGAFWRLYAHARKVFSGSSPSSFLYCKGSLRKGFTAPLSTRSSKRGSSQAAPPPTTVAPLKLVAPDKAPLVALAAEVVLLQVALRFEPSSKSPPLFAHPSTPPEAVADLQAPPLQALPQTGVSEKCPRLHLSGLPKFCIVTWERFREFPGLSLF